MEEISLKPVSSSNIDSIGYSIATETLRVQFKTGAIYDYEGVPVEVYQQMQNASSVGCYLNKHIKNTYAYTRVS